MRSNFLGLAGYMTSINDAFGSLTSTYGGLGLLAVAVADSSFLTLPEANDVLIVLLSAGKNWSEMAYYVLMTTVGSLIGCTLLYTAGRKGGRPLLQKRFDEKNLQRVEGLLRRFGTLTLFVPSLLPPPCPFKVFVLTAGVFNIKLPEFVGVVAIGRTIRYSTWGVLAVLYGDQIKSFMENNLSWIGLLLLILFLSIAGTFAFRTFRRHPDKRGA
jgi:membrane protein YqaA with SNARE-associated domain